MESEDVRALVAAAVAAAVAETRKEVLELLAAENAARMQSQKEMGQELAAEREAGAQTEARLAEVEATLRNVLKREPATTESTTTIRVQPSPAARRTDGGDADNGMDGGGTASASTPTPLPWMLSGPLNDTPGGPIHSARMDEGGRDGTAEGVGGTDGQAGGGEPPPPRRMSVLAAHGLSDRQLAAMAATGQELPSSKMYVMRGLLMLFGTLPMGVAYWGCLVLDDARYGRGDGATTRTCAAPHVLTADQHTSRY